MLKQQAVEYNNETLFLKSQKWICRFFRGFYEIDVDHRKSAIRVFRFARCIETQRNGRPGISRLSFDGCGGELEICTTRNDTCSAPIGAQRRGRRVEKKSNKMHSIVGPG